MLLFCFFLVTSEHGLREELQQLSTCTDLHRRGAPDLLEREESKESWSVLCCKDQHQNLQNHAIHSGLSHLFRDLKDLQGLQGKRYVPVITIVAC